VSHPQLPDLDPLLAAWAGRALLGRELADPRRAGDGALEAAERAVAAGMAEKVPAIAREWPGWRCARCGGRSVQLAPCGRCGRWTCPYCEECAPLGRPGAAITSTGSPCCLAERRGPRPQPRGQASKATANRVIPGPGFLSP